MVYNYGIFQIWNFYTSKLFDISFLELLNLGTLHYETFQLGSLKLCNFSTSSLMFLNF